MKYFKLEYINGKFKIAGMYDSPTIDNSTDAMIFNEFELSLIKPEFIINIDRYIQNK